MNRDEIQSMHRTILYALPADELVVVWNIVIALARDDRVCDHGGGAEEDGVGLPIEGPRV